MSKIEKSNPRLIPLFRIVSLVLGLVVLVYHQASATEVGGFVYCDNNHNGSYDDGEGLLVADLEVKVFRKNTDDLIKTAITDDKGKYSANSLPSGSEIDVKVVYEGVTYTSSGTLPLLTAHVKVACKSTDCDQPPSISIIKDGDINCSKTSVMIVASVTPDEGANYDWFIPNGATDPGNAASFSTSVAGTYKVVVKYNSNHCTASSSITIAADETECCLTITNPDPADPKSICEGENVTFLVETDPPPPVEIGWVRFDSEVSDPYTATGNGKTHLVAAKPSGGFASASSDNFPAVDGGIKTYYVYACFKYASPNCKGFVKYQVNVIKPKVMAMGGSFSCPITSGQLSAIGTPAEGVISSYNWTGPGGFTSDSQNPTVSVVGEYKVVYSATKDGKTCTVSDSAVVDCCPVNICVPVIVSKTRMGER